MALIWWKKNKKSKIWRKTKLKIRHLIKKRKQIKLIWIWKINTIKSLIFSIGGLPLELW